MNAAGTSRSPVCGPRRSSSAPTSTAAGSCQLGPLMPSPPTTTVLGGASGSLRSDRRSASTSSDEADGPAPRSERRSPTSPSPRTSTGSVAYELSPASEPEKCAAAASRSSSDGSPSRDPAFIGWNSSPSDPPSPAAPAGSPASTTTTSGSASSDAGSPRMSSIGSREPESYHASAGSPSAAPSSNSPGVTSAGSSSWVGSGGSSERTSTCDSFGALPVGPSGSSQSTSRIGAKNLSRSSKRSSPLPLSLAT